MGGSPLYRSGSTVKSLWQEYIVFADRLEFDTVFGLISIPFDEVEGIEVSESEVRGLLRGDLHLKGFRPAIKLDWANFLEHVVIDKSGGLVRRFLITPDDPRAFKAALDRALAAWRRQSG